MSDSSVLGFALIAMGIGFGVLVVLLQSGKGRR